MKIIVVFLRLQLSVSITLSKAGEKTSSLSSMSVLVLVVSPELCVAINELVPGDSGGSTAFSDLNIRWGIAGAGAEIVER